MNRLYDLGDLRQFQQVVYERRLFSYANSVLNREMSFNRAAKALHFDTGDDLVYVEEDLAAAVAKLCPTIKEG